MITTTEDYNDLRQSVNARYEVEVKLLTENNLLKRAGTFPTSGGPDRIVLLEWNDNKDAAHLYTDNTTHSTVYISLYEVEYSVETGEIVSPSPFKPGVPYNVHFSTTDSNISLYIETDGGSSQITGDTTLTLTNEDVTMVALRITRRVAVDADVEVSITTDDGVTYGMNDIISCKIKKDLFSGNGPQIGASVSARCDLVLYEDTENWPRMAQFEVLVRLVDGSDVSEWISFGKFYTDERSFDSGKLSITAYDGMLLLEQSWTDKISQQTMPSSWPITARAAANLLIEASGVLFDESIVLDNTFKWFGLDTTSTVREGWASIAAAMGGNCTLTRDGKIRIVPLKLLSDAIDLDLSVKSLNTSDSFDPITGVELKSEDGNKAIAGNDNGYRIQCECEFSDVNVATLCLSNVSGYVYRPFTAGGTYLDPASDLGDKVSIGDNVFQIFTTDWTLGGSILCDISAPYEAEVDHEYTKEKEYGKTLRKAVEKSKAYSDGQLNSFITTTYANDLDAIEQQIDGKAETWYQSADPSTNWTEAQKASHEGDIWYDTANDLAYIWNGTQWDEMTAEVPQEIFDKIDGKAQIFISQPVPPYNVGDLWFNSADDGIRTCTTAKGVGGTFSENDWQERNKYTDDTTARSAVEATEQLDSEFRAFKTEIIQSVDDVSISVVQVNDNLDELKMHYRFDAEGETIGKSNSEKTITLSNDGIDMKVNNESITHWNQDEMYAPRKVNIPFGGSLQIGDFIWQPRRNGNMSVLWVGE